MTCRCIRAVFVAFLLLSLFQATRFQQATTAQVDDKRFSAAELVSPPPQFSTTEEVSVTEVVGAEETYSWRLLERVRVFSTMTMSYNWSARFNDRDHEKTLTVVFSYSYIAGYHSDTINVKQAGGYVTAAIEDFCRRSGSHLLKDYYFE